MRFRIVAAILCMFAVEATIAQAQGWTGIVPLRSTRADVERLFGQSQHQCDCFHQVAGEFISVEYAKAPCEGYPSGWNVPADTVLSFSVRSDQPRRFSELRLDESRFEKAYDDTANTYYADPYRGVQYTVSHDGLVRDTKYFPSTRDTYLRCPCFPPDDESIFRTPPIGSFSGQSLANAQAYLDDLAVELQFGSGVKGYVVVYAGKNASPSYVRTYAAGLRRHLALRRGISSDKFSMINGGYRETTSVEMYLFRKDMPPPTPRPTYVPCQRRQRKSIRPRKRGRA